MKFGDILKSKEAEGEHRIKISLEPLLPFEIDQQ